MCVENAVHVVQQLRVEPAISLRACSILSLLSCDQSFKITTASIKSIKMESSQCKCQAHAHGGE